MKKEHCILCHGTEWCDVPTERGGYKNTKCDHVWEHTAIMGRMQIIYKKFNEIKKEYEDISECFNTMKEIK